MAPTALLVLNPGARKGGDDHTAIVDALRERGLTVVAETLQAAREIPRVIARHAPNVERVIVGGGDGTVAAATRPLMEAKLPLGILPLGTANNVARTLGIPEDLEKACAVAAGTNHRPIDVGEVNGRAFLTTASFGLSVAITHALTSDAKRRWGKLAYALTAVRAATRARPIRAHIRWGHGELHTRTVQVVVGNGRYYGTALQVAEDATIDDHALDLYSLEVRHWWQLLVLGPLLKRGRHGRHPAVATARAPAFEITTAVPMAIDADGEIVAHTPATFRVLPDALVVFAPDAREHRDSA